MNGLTVVAERAARYRQLLDVNESVASLETAEAVLRAKTALVDALISARWTPPAEVLEELHTDKLLLQERPGALRG